MPPPPSSTPPARVLVADSSLPNRRLVREALSAFHRCEVDDSASGEHAFERALHRTYALFVFAMALPDISGPLLDRLLARTYPRVHPDTHTAPPVIFLVRPEDTAAFHEVARDARVRGAVPVPLDIEALMNSVGAALPPKNS